jgi:CRISPR-associated protein Cas2
MIVAYDISVDRRREQVAKILSAYGDRVQYSVFVVDVEPVKGARMIRALEQVTVPDEDSILVCDLGPVTAAEQRSFTYLGRTRPITGPESFIL